MTHFKALQQNWGYTFQDEELLKLALTHSSFANEHKTGGLQYNERLEFLGDSVLGFVVSEYLYKHYSHLPEGELTKIRAAVVCEKALYHCAVKIGIGPALLLGRGEEQGGGRERVSVLADAFEALIAATFLDGGIENVKNAVLPMMKNPIALAANGKINRDYKTNLQEIVQKNKQETLTYVLTGEEGPDHDKTFYVELHLNSNIFAKGKGRSKKEAEQDAAREALVLMGEI